jgi:hypothetical protein
MKTRLFFFTISLIILFNFSDAQTPISFPKVGNKIDSLERFQYFIFSEYSNKGIEYLEIVKMEGGFYILVAHKFDGKVETSNIEFYEIENIKKRLAVFLSEYNSNDTTIEYMVKTIFGNLHFGKITCYNKDSICIDNNIKLNTNEVELIIEKNKDYKSDNSRYFSAPSALTLIRSQWYFRNENFFFNRFYYGVSDKLTLETGLKCTFPHAIYGLNFGVKYQLLKIKNFSLATGLSLQYDFLLQDFPLSPTFYVVSSLTGKRISISGYLDPYSYQKVTGNSNILNSYSSLANVSLKIKLIDNFSLILENWVYYNKNDGKEYLLYFPKGGLSFSIKKFSIDLGFMYFGKSEGEEMMPPVYPFFGITYNKF